MIRALGSFSYVRGRAFDPPFGPCHSFLNFLNYFCTDSHDKLAQLCESWIRRVGKQKFGTKLSLPRNPRRQLQAPIADWLNGPPRPSPFVCPRWSLMLRLASFLGNVSLCLTIKWVTGHFIVPSMGAHWKKPTRTKTRMRCYDPSVISKEETQWMGDVQVIGQNPEATSVDK